MDDTKHSVYIQVLIHLNVFGHTICTNTAGGRKKTSSSSHMRKGKWSTFYSNNTRMFCMYLHSAFLNFILTFMLCIAKLND